MSRGKNKHLTDSSFPDEFLAYIQGELDKDKIKARIQFGEEISDELKNSFSEWLIED